VPRVLHRPGYLSGRSLVEMARATVVFRDQQAGVSGLPVAVVVGLVVRGACHILIKVLSGALGSSSYTSVYIHTHTYLCSEPWFASLLN
jgi:hypothetical protein